ncbi:MAG: CocE/NonD family hydrolase [Flavobacteriaceae bacterium]|nr:CocE/NonD family hydrolase [Flavobacteriaceae bacterium]
MNKLLVVLFLIFSNLAVVGQSLKFEKVDLSDTTTLVTEMKKLAKDYLHQYELKNLEIESQDLFGIQILAGNFEASIKTIYLLRKVSEVKEEHPSYIQYEIFSEAKVKQLKSGIAFKDSYQSLFRNYLMNCDDKKAYTANFIFTTYDAVAQFTNHFESNYKNVSGTSISFGEALTLLQSYFLYHIYSVAEPIAFKEIKLDDSRRYLTKEELIISPRDGAEISVITVRKRNVVPMPAVLLFTIYADASNYDQALLAASKGYVGVVATSRGKRFSKNAIEPYKYEYKDVYVVIDWISQQPWCNAKIGMYGGSYNGFSQWSSTKEKVHPALKTIVPSVSAAPGIDVPMENNIFYNFSYKWIPYVTNNKFLDNAANFDGDRWSNLENKWFESGKPFNKMDSIDGTPNKLFQEWVSHPSYDSYWQSMIPYKDDFAHIDIPILTTTGYYDDGQRGAMYYYLEHLKYNPKAEHYLLIGPYDHWGAQSRSNANLRGYQIDSVATINIQQGLVFDWFDYILKGKEKPSVLKDKVNFQVMGTNTWMHKSSLNAMTNDTLKFYLNDTKTDQFYTLNTKENQSKIELNVDFKDRDSMNNADYYPWPLERKEINLKDGLIFKSDALKEDIIINGSFLGNLEFSINKKDIDYSVILYELTPENTYFHLSYFIGRASFEKGKEHRVLLTPDTFTKISFNNTRIISKKLQKGSRIVIVINANKNPYGQINYGTGKDVSAESLKDATIPLKLILSGKSSLSLPVWNAAK